MTYNQAKQRIAALRSALTSVEIMKNYVLVLAMVFCLGCLASKNGDAKTNVFMARCVVEYTITEEGNVKDVRVVECELKGKGFKQRSIRAAKKLKYKPKLVDGKAV